MLHKVDLLTRLCWLAAMQVNMVSEQPGTYLTPISPRSAYPVDVELTVVWKVIVDDQRDLHI